MKTYSLENLKVRFTQLGLQWHPFHLVGVRSAADKANAFDDTFYLIKGNILFQTACTTNPGSYWLQNIMPGKTGAAVLKSNMQFKDCWALGNHKGLHPALIQVKPVTVIRDGDGDLQSEEVGKEDTGLFGINIHRANATTISKIIDKWSAGCQVLPDPKMMDFVLEKCKESGQKLFTYSLLREF